MEYMVIGADGTEYGPAKVDTLAQWASENRLAPTTMLKEFATGRTIAASAVPGIFPALAPPQVANPPMSAGPYTGPSTGPSTGPAGPGQAPPGQNWSQPPNYYQRGPGQANPKPYYGQTTGGGDIVLSIIWAVLSVVLFFFLHGLGVIVGIYGVIRAFRAQSQGHKLAPVAIVISILALAAVVVGWLLRLNGAGV